MSLTGNLEDLSLGDIFQILFLSRRSGVLSINGISTKGKIYLHKGMIISGESNKVSNTLENVLIDSNLADANDLENINKTVAQCDNREALYEALAKYLSTKKESIKEEVKKRLESIVFSLFLSEGNFDFELSEAEKEFSFIKENPRQIVYDEPGLNPQYLAMEGTRLADERGRDTPAEPKTKEESHSAELIKTEKGIEQKTRELDSGDEMSGVVAQKETIVSTEGFNEVAPSPGLWLLKSMLYELQDPHTNSEITLLLLRFASELMNRAVLLMKKKDHLSGLGQFGVSIKDKDANRVVRAIKIPLDEPSIFKETLKQKIAIKKSLIDNHWNNYFIKEIGGEWPKEAFVAPIIVNRKVAAILYGDNLPEKRNIGSTETLEIFLYQAGMAMERALLERRLTDSSLKINKVNDEIK